MKSKTKKQVAYLLSKASPPKEKQQDKPKPKSELHSGPVKIKK